MIILVAVNIDTLSIISAVLITNRFLMFIIYSQFWDTILFPWIINYISMSILINITINISACIWRHSLLHIILSKYTLIKFPTDWISFSLHYLILRLSKLFFRNFIYSVSSSVLQFYITIMFSKLISFLGTTLGENRSNTVFCIKFNQSRHRVSFATFLQTYHDGLWPPPLIGFYMHFQQVTEAGEHGILFPANQVPSLERLDCVRGFVSKRT